MQGFPIQQAKVQRPPLRPATLRRDRLITWLDERAKNRLILVTAEAGYGKTTLLADWARRAPIRVAWYRIEQDDANWASFLRYLVAAGRELDPAFAPLTSVLLDELAVGANNRDMIQATFLQELDQLVATRRVAFVLDDAHLLRTERDVVNLLSDLVNRGPERITWILAGRQRPSIVVSKLRALGEVQELRRLELRFRLEETTELFDSIFAHPIADDLVRTITERTDGWVASIRLVDAAIRDRSDTETRTFIESLSGARGELYDYLAEEVVGELEPHVQDFLMNTSVIRVVTIANIGLVTNLSVTDAASVVEEILPLGLLDVAGPDEPGAYRYHPLVREFLESRLRQENGDIVASALHRKLAVAHEGRDWRTAAYHYEAIGAVDDLQRVLVESAPTIMARGEFDIAKRHVDRLGPESDPAMDLFVSRVELDLGSAHSALRRARAAYEGTVASRSGLRHLALANLVSITTSVGSIEESERLCEVLLNSDAPQRLLDIGLALKMAAAASFNGNLGQYQRHLALMEESHRGNDNLHYLAVTLLNQGIVAQAQGHASMSLAKSTEAISLLRTGPRRAELTAARMNHAWALGHLGRWSEASAELLQAVADVDGLARNEALIESADTWVWYGDLAGAARLIGLARRDANPSQLATTHLPLAEVELLLRRGEPARALELAQHLPARPNGAAIAYSARRLYVLALAAVMAGTDGAGALVEHAHAFALSQEADFFASCLEVLAGCVSPEREFSSRLDGVVARDPSYASILADVVAIRLHLLTDSVLGEVANEAQRRPERWRDPLRKALGSSQDSELRAAHLLELVGTSDDVALLREIARTPKGRRQARRLGYELAKRVAPRVFVEDLGRIRIQVGGNELANLDARRKVFEVVCYLLTRPNLSATRDQVLDAVWPDSDPASALNSLNQTLYFLRRVIEPEYSENLSPSYVHHDSDIIWFDTDLVDSRSLRCKRLLAEVTTANSYSNLRGLSLEYAGKFALDFDYEEWANTFRDRLHAAYLQVMESGIHAELEAGRSLDAAVLARRTLDIDPTAEQIERLLLRAYYEANAHAAVREQYAHYASMLRNELGIDPPSLARLVEARFDSGIDT